MDQSPLKLVLVINDDTVFLELMQELLIDEGYRCEVLKSSKTAHKHIKERWPDRS